MPVTSLLGDRTLAELVEHLGNVDLQRIRVEPAPGLARPRDVQRIREREKRLFELVDGVLVEKVMGFRESLVALAIARLIGAFVSRLNLGVVAGADGMMRLLDDTVRIPDVAFIAWAKLPGGKVPDHAVPNVCPSLAVEVLSAGNTVTEMRRKRAEYFEAGVEIVWEIDIEDRYLTAYTQSEEPDRYEAHDVVTCSVLPGFVLPLEEVFEELDRHA
ncbi:MAG TPA: Uma2 family endonuclease [Planctomycetaceae bacterium]|nr:Uma2 family endonuclease [Planctomycetaceae bacterium]